MKNGNFGLHIYDVSEINIINLIVFHLLRLFNFDKLSKSVFAFVEHDIYVCFRLAKLRIR